MRTKRRPNLADYEIAERLPLIVKLIAAWSTGDAAEASPDRVELAILMVDSLYGHLQAGTSPLDLVDEICTNEQAAEALGQKFIPIAELVYRAQADAAAADARHAPPPPPPPSTLPDLGASQ